MIKKLPPLKGIKDYEQFYKYLVRGLRQPRGTLIQTTEFFLNMKNEYALAKHLNKKEYPTNWLCYSPRINNKVKNGYAMFDEKKIFVQK